MRESSGWLEANLRAAGVVMPALIQDIGHYEKARTVMTRALLTQVAVAQHSHLLDALEEHWPPQAAECLSENFTRR